MNDTAPELIPLGVAARVLFVYSHGIKRPVGHVVERLNGFAYVLAASGPLYAGAGRHGVARRVSRTELTEGFFRRAATELHFLDGRPALTGIAIMRDTLEKTIGRLGKETQASAAFLGELFSPA